MGLQKRGELAAESLGVEKGNATLSLASPIAQLREETEESFDRALFGQVHHGKATGHKDYCSYSIAGIQAGAVFVRKSVI
ncbi:hypothetical protein ABZP36_034150 [Zizania latifolia]